jgi:outer membrane lipoprotein SlyB
MEPTRVRSDPRRMNKKVVAMCVIVGSTIGGYLPTFVGQGSFSAASIIGSFLGGVAGVFAARSIDADF